MAALNPPAAHVALARLANPWNDVAWPLVNNLILRDPPTRIAHGQSFEVEVADAYGAELPAEVLIHYRFENAEGRPVVESETLRYVAGSIRARRENVSRSFSFRVEGGDDHSMPWYPVEVVDPPAVESLAVRLLPPAYSGWPPEQTAGNNLRALVGTQLQIAGRATRPLASAMLVFDDGRQVPAQVAPDGLGFSIPASASLVVEHSVAYGFRLTDSQGMTGESPYWELRALNDAPPRAVIESPASQVFVTPSAILPLRVVADDDLAVQRVTLAYRDSGAQAAHPSDRSLEASRDSGAWRKSSAPGAPAPEVSRADKPVSPAPAPEVAELTIFAGPSQPPPRPANDAPTGAGHVVVNYAWRLERLDLKPGSQGTFWASATDYRPQTGQSEPRQLIVVTPEELADRIAARQGTVVEELRRALATQREARTQVRALQLHAVPNASLGRPELDRLRSAELGQRRVLQILTSPNDGVPAHVAALLTDLANNKIDSPDIQRRMRSVLDELDRLGRTDLPAIARDLTDAAKSLEVRLDEPPSSPRPLPEEGAASPASKSPRPQAGEGQGTRGDRSAPNSSFADVLAPLNAAAAGQDRAIAALEAMLDRLERWDRFRQFHRQVGQLLRDQEELSRQTDALARRTLTRELKELPPQDAADLQLRAQTQIDLALRFDRIQAAMDQAVGPLEQTDPLAAQTVADAVLRARSLNPSGAMRTAAAEIDRNRMGQARSRQDTIQRALRELLDILSNRREDELARLAGRYQDAENRLADLARRQQTLAQRFAQADPTDRDKAAADLAPWTEEQQRLQVEAQGVARRLEQLLASQPAQSAADAAKRMGLAQQSAAQGQSRAAAESAEQARKQLDAARRQLAATRQQAEAELAQQRAAELREALESLAARQQQALDQTRRLDGLRPVQPTAAATLPSTVDELAGRQRALHSEVAALEKKCPAAEIFAFALFDAGRAMAVASGLLDRRQTGPPTQQAQHDALLRLARILEALKPEPSQPPDGNAPPRPDSGNDAQRDDPQRPRAPERDVPRVAQLKLLKLLQEDLNRRTSQLGEELRGPLRNRNRFASNSVNSATTRADWPNCSWPSPRRTKTNRPLIPLRNPRPRIPHPRAPKKRNPRRPPREPCPAKLACRGDLTRGVFRGALG